MEMYIGWRRRSTNIGKRLTGVSITPSYESYFDVEAWIAAE
jgi:hypothetical protein